MPAAASTQIFSNQAKDIQLSVVTVTYNERENITPLIEKLNEIFQGNNIIGEVVVVDDSSPDGTSETVLELRKKYPKVVLVKRPDKMGIASAYKDGLKTARGEVITFMDADLSMPPTILPQLYQIASEGKIGWGSRYLKKTKFETDWFHYLGASVLNKWIAHWLKTRIKDHTLGYVCLKRKLLEKILNYGKEKEVSPFDQVLYGLPISALSTKLNLSIVEIESPYEKRTYGETKIKFVNGVKLVLSNMKQTLELRKKLGR